jgi:hypothetical protein
MHDLRVDDDRVRLRWSIAKAIDLRGRYAGRTFVVGQPIENDVGQTPSLPGTRPRSDRFRCGGRESKFLAATSSLATECITMNNPYFICRKWLCMALSGLCLIAAVTNADEVLEKRQARIAAELEALPVARGRCVLFSLEHADRVRDVINDEKYFHGFAILGKADVDEEKDKNALIAALADGVRESDGVGKRCFNPRHGIRFILGEATYDFVICFTAIP